MRVLDYDICALNEAKQRLLSVQGYYYGDGELRRFNRRLETILGKLNEAIALAKETREEEDHVDR
jgi:hypothetical protein